MEKKTIRAKNGAVRIAIGDIQGTVSYLNVEAKRCWVTTFKSWGKTANDAVVFIDGTKYRITVDPIG